MNGVLFFALGELSIKQEMKSLRHRLGKRKGGNIILAGSRGNDFLDQVLRSETEFLEFEEFTDRARRSLSVFLRKDHDRGGDSALGGLGLEKERFGERCGGVVGGSKSELCLPFGSTFYGGVGDDIGVGDLELGETVEDGGVCDGHGVDMVSCGDKSSRVLEEGTEHESVGAVEEKKVENKRDRHFSFVDLFGIDQCYVITISLSRLTHPSPTTPTPSLGNSSVQLSPL